MPFLEIPRFIVEISIGIPNTPTSHFIWRVQKKQNLVQLCRPFRDLARLIFLCNNMWWYVMFFVNIHYVKRFFNTFKFFCPPIFRCTCWKDCLASHFKFQAMQSSRRSEVVATGGRRADIEASSFFVHNFCLPAKPAKNREPEVEFKTKLRRFSRR